MSDPIMGWFEIIQYDEKNDDNHKISGDCVNNQVPLFNIYHI